MNKLIILSIVFIIIIISSVSAYFILNKKQPPPIQQPPIRQQSQLTQPPPVQQPSSPQQPSIKKQSLSTDNTTEEQLPPLIEENTPTSIITPTSNTSSIGSLSIPSIKTPSTPITSTPSTPSLKLGGNFVTIPTTPSTTPTPSSPTPSSTIPPTPSTTPSSPTSPTPPTSPTTEIKGISNPDAFIGSDNGVVTQQNAFSACQAQDEPVSFCKMPSNYVKKCGPFTFSSSQISQGYSLKMKDCIKNRLSDTNKDSYNEARDYLIQMDPKVSIVPYPSADVNCMQESNPNYFCKNPMLYVDNCRELNSTSNYQYIYNLKKCMDPSMLGMKLTDKKEYENARDYFIGLSGEYENELPVYPKEGIICGDQTRREIFCKNPTDYYESCKIASGYSDSSYANRLNDCVLKNLVTESEYNNMKDVILLKSPSLEKDILPFEKSMCVDYNDTSKFCKNPYDMVKNCDYSLDDKAYKLNGCLDNGVDEEEFSKARSYIISLDEKYDNIINRYTNLDCKSLSTKQVEDFCTKPEEYIKECEIYVKQISSSNIYSKDSAFYRNMYSCIIDNKETDVLSWNNAKDYLSTKGLTLPNYTTLNCTDYQTQFCKKPYEYMTECKDILSTVNGPKSPTEFNNLLKGCFMSEKGLGEIKDSIASYTKAVDYLNNNGITDKYSKDIPDNVCVNIDAKVPGIGPNTDISQFLNINNVKGCKDVTDVNKWFESIFKNYHSGDIPLKDSEVSKYEEIKEYMSSLGYDIPPFTEFNCSDTDPVRNIDIRRNMLKFIKECPYKERDLAFFAKSILNNDNIKCKTDMYPDDKVQYLNTLQYLKQNPQICSYGNTVDLGCNSNGINILKKDVTVKDPSLLYFCGDGLVKASNSCTVNVFERTETGAFRDRNYAILYRDTNYKNELRRVKPGEIFDVSNIGSIKVVPGILVKIGLTETVIMNNSLDIVIDHNIEDFQAWYIYSFLDTSINNSRIGNLYNFYINTIIPTTYKQQTLVSAIFKDKDFKGDKMFLYLNQPVLIGKYKNLTLNPPCDFNIEWRYKSLYSTDELTYEIIKYEDASRKFTKKTISLTSLLDISINFPFDNNELYPARNNTSDVFYFINLIDTSVTVTTKNKLLPTPTMFSDSGEYNPCFDNDYKSSNILQCYSKESVCKDFPDIGITIKDDCLSIGIDPLKEGCSKNEEFAFRKEKECTSIGLNPTLQFTCRKESSIFDSSIRDKCLTLSNGTVDPCQINKDYSEKMSFGPNRKPNACTDSVLKDCETNPSYGDSYRQGGAYDTNMYSRCYDAWQQGKIDFCKNPTFFENFKEICGYACLAEADKYWTTPEGIEKCKKSFPSPCTTDYKIRRGSTLNTISPSEFRQKYPEACFEGDKLVPGIKHPCEEFPSLYYDKKDVCDKLGFNVCEKIPGYALQFPERCPNTICKFPSNDNVKKELVSLNVSEFKKRISDEKAGVDCSYNRDLNRDLCYKDPVPRPLGSLSEEVLNDPLDLYTDSSKTKASYYAGQVARQMVRTEEGAKVCESKGIEMCNDPEFMDLNFDYCKKKGINICKSKTYATNNPKECRQQVKNLCSTSNEYNTYHKDDLCGTCDTSQKIRELDFKECNYKACEDQLFLTFNMDECMTKYKGDLCSLPFVKTDGNLIKALTGCTELYVPKCKDSSYYNNNPSLCNILGVTIEDTLTQDDLKQICNNPKGMKQQVKMFSSGDNVGKVDTIYTWNSTIINKCINENMDPCKMEEYRSNNVEECRKRGFDPCNDSVYFNDNKVNCMKLGFGVDCNDYNTLITESQGKCKDTFIDSCNNDNNFYSQNTRLCEGLNPTQDCITTEVTSGCEPDSNNIWYKTKKQIITQPSKGRGKPCPKELEEKESCSVDCVLDSKLNISSCQPENTYYSTGSSTKYYKKLSFNHIVEAEKGGKCNDNTKYEYCPPKDCEYTAWKSFGVCYTDNNTIKTSYTRSAISNPENGGKDCDNTTLNRVDTFNSLDECNKSFSDMCKDTKFFRDPMNTTKCVEKGFRTNQDICKDNITYYNNKGLCSGYINPCADPEYLKTNIKDCLPPTQKEMCIGGSISDATCRLVGIEPCLYNKGYLEQNKDECRSKGFEPCDNDSYLEQNKDECRSKGIEPCEKLSINKLSYYDCKNNNIDLCNNPEFYSKNKRLCDCDYVINDNVCKLSTKDNKYHKDLTIISSSSGLGKTCPSLEDTPVCPPIDCKYTIGETQDCQRFSDGKWYEYRWKTNINMALNGGKECDTDMEKLQIKGKECLAEDCKVKKWKIGDCELDKDNKCVQKYIPDEFEPSKYGGKCDTSISKIEGECTTDAGINYCNSIMPKDCELGWYDNYYKPRVCEFNDNGDCEAEIEQVPYVLVNEQNGGKCDITQKKVRKESCDKSICEMNRCTSKSAITVPKSQSDCPKDTLFISGAYTTFNQQTMKEEMYNSCAIMNSDNTSNCHSNFNGSFQYESSNPQMPLRTIDKMKEDNKLKFDCINLPSKKPLSQSDCYDGFSFEPNFALTYSNGYKLANSCVQKDSDNTVLCYSSPDYNGKYTYNFTNVPSMGSMAKTWFNFDSMKKNNQSIGVPMSIKTHIKFSDYNKYMRSMQIKI